MRSFLIGPESSTVLLFPVRQSLVRHGMSSGPGLGPSCGGTPLTARRFRLHSQLMQGSSSFAPYTLDFLSVDPPPLRKFRKVFFCSNMFLLHCHEIHGLRSLRSLSSSARLWAQSHGFSLSFPNNSPVEVIKIKVTLRKMSDQNPMLLSLARKREIKYLFRSYRTTLYSGLMSNNSQHHSFDEPIKNFFLVNNDTLRVIPNVLTSSCKCCFQFIAHRKQKTVQRPEFL